MARKLKIKHEIVIPMKASEFRKLGAEKYNAVVRPILKEVLAGKRISQIISHFGDR